MATKRFMKTYQNANAIAAGLHYQPGLSDADADEYGPMKFVFIQNSCNIQLKVKINGFENYFFLIPANSSREWPITFKFVSIQNTHGSLAIPADALTVSYQNFIGGK